MHAADVCELVPCEIRNEECDINIAVWTCGAFGVGAEEVGGCDRGIGLNDGRSGGEDVGLREDESGCRRSGNATGSHWKGLC